MQIYAYMSKQSIMKERSRVSMLIASYVDRAAEWMDRGGGQIDPGPQGIGPS